MKFDTRVALRLRDGFGRVLISKHEVDRLSHIGLSCIRRTDDHVQTALETQGSIQSLRAGNSEFLETEPECHDPSSAHNTDSCENSAPHCPMWELVSALS